MRVRVRHSRQERRLREEHPEEEAAAAAVSVVFAATGVFPPFLSFCWCWCCCSALFAPFRRASFSSSLAGGLPGLGAADDAALDQDQGPQRGTGRRRSFDSFFFFCCRRQQSEAPRAARRRRLWRRLLHRRPALPLAFAGPLCARGAEGGGDDSSSGGRRSRRKRRRKKTRPGRSSRPRPRLLLLPGFRDRRGARGRAEAPSLPARGRLHAAGPRTVAPEAASPGGRHQGQAPKGRRVVVELLFGAVAACSFSSSFFFFRRRETISVVDDPDHGESGGPVGGPEETEGGGRRARGRGGGEKGPWIWRRRRSNPNKACLARGAGCRVPPFLDRVSRRPRSGKGEEKRRP